jgi:hypothetical protein
MLLLFLPIAAIIAVSTSDGTTAATGIGTVAQAADDDRVYVVEVDRAKAASAVIRVLDSAGHELTTLRPSRPAEQPSLVVSPSGDRAYLSYATQDASGLYGGVLEVIDTSTGASSYVGENPNRWTSTLPEHQAHEMALSDDGTWLVQMKMRSPTPGYTEYYLAVFDTSSLAFLPDTAPLPLCVTGRLQSTPGDRTRWNLLCSHTQDLRTVTLTPTGAVAAPVSEVSLSNDPSHGHPATMIGLSGGRVIAMSRDGAYVAVNQWSGQVYERGSVRQGSAAWPADKEIRPHVGVVSEDGQRAVLLLGDGRTSEVVVVSSTRLARERAFVLNRRIVSIALSRDAQRIYAVDGTSPSLIVLDVRTGEQVTHSVDATHSPVFVTVGRRR